MFYTSICAIAKDENSYLKEWILYHLSIGFEHIILYDNNSKIPIKHEISEFVSSGLVHVIDFPHNNAPQLSAYYHCIKKYRNSSFWLAFIDIDEFIVPLMHSDIRDFLDDYRDYAGIGIHWMIFGSNGHIKRPLTSLIKSYNESLGLNSHIKSIVQPKFVLNPISPHHFKYEDSYYCVNEDKIIIPSFNSYPLGNKIRINHYYYKSQQEFEEKIERGLATKINNNSNRDISTFYSHINKEIVINNDILRFSHIFEKFSSFSIQTIRNIINNYNENSIESEILYIQNNINTISIEELINRINILKRHNDLPDLDILELYIYISKNDSINIAKLFSNGILKYNSNKQIVEIYYKAIAHWYLTTGRQADSYAVDKFAQ